MPRAALRLLPILSFPHPSRDPRLPRIFPHFLIVPLGLDTFGAREAFPFSWGVEAWCGGAELLEGWSAERASEELDGVSWLIGGTLCGHG